MTQETPIWLDYSKPPPKYTVTESCGWWPADDAGELVREDESFDTEADARAAAWAHYKAWHHPHGMPQCHADHRAAVASLPYNPPTRYHSITT